MASNKDMHDAVLKVEDVEAIQHVKESSEDDNAMSPTKRNYLLERHGTLELEPMPSSDPEDPYNWPQWKKNTNLALLSFHSFTVTFIAVGIVPAFGQMHKDFHVSIPTISYLVSLQILLGGFAPLLWAPLSDRYGRRPLALASTLVSGLGNIGCALSKSYGTAMFWRCWVAFWLCPPTAMGSTMVVEMFFHHERARKLGIWTLMITLGPPAAPFLMGFVAQRLGYKWIYYIFAIMNFVQFAAYLAFKGETRYLGSQSSPAHAKGLRKYIWFHRIDTSEFHLREFYAPILLTRSPKAFIAAFSYSVVLVFCTVFLTIEIPEMYIPKFKLNPEQLGMQFLGRIIGTLIGEQLAGPLSDWWMQRANKKAIAAQTPKPRHEHRLWLSYLGFLLAMGGLVQFGVMTSKLPKYHWNVTPLIGIGIASAGVQIVTTILITYIVDCHPQHRSVVGSFVNVVRNTWGFVCPFFFPEMIERLGPAKCTGVLAALMGAVSMAPIIGCHVLGGRKAV